MSHSGTGLISPNYPQTRDPHAAPLGTGLLLGFHSYMERDYVTVHIRSLKLHSIVEVIVLS